VKRHHLISTLAALVVVALIAWIASNSYWVESETRLGPRGEALTNPFYSAQRLADMLGAHTRLRHEIVRVPSPKAVIVLDDWNWSIFPERRRRLEQWVSDGGRLVASQSLLSDPQFNTWTGVARERLVDRRARECTLANPCVNEEDVGGSGAGKTNRRWEICELLPWTYLTTTRKVTWRIRDSRAHAQIVRVPIGRGNVTIINAEPFKEEATLCGDNALLFVRATQLHAGDQIEFLSEAGGSSLLQLIWKYGAPVVMLLAAAIVLWLWRSGVRFGPLVAVPDPARRSLAEQIRGTGQFMMRFGGGRALHAAAMRALDETAARRIPHYERLSGEVRITKLAPLTGMGAAELSVALDRAIGRNPHELRKAIATLELARRHMAQAGHNN
jgi:hypothetical protein